MAAEEKKVETLTPKSRNIRLASGRMGLAEYKRQDWVVDAEFGTTIEDVLKPSYFANYAEIMKPYDSIEVRSEDGTWIAFLKATGTGSSFVRCLLVQKIECEPDDQAPPVESVDFIVAWKGPYHQWAVIRKADSTIVKAQCESRMAAHMWLAEHERTIKAKVS